MMMVWLNCNIKLNREIEYVELLINVVCLCEHYWMRVCSCYAEVKFALDEFKILVWGKTLSCYAVIDLWFVLSRQNM